MPGVSVAVLIPELQYLELDDVIKIEAVCLLNLYKATEGSLAVDLYPILEELFIVFLKNDWQLLFTCLDWYLPANVEKEDIKGCCNWITDSLAKNQMYIKKRALERLSPSYSPSKFEYDNYHEWFAISMYSYLNGELSMDVLRPMYDIYCPVYDLFNTYDKVPHEDVITHHFFYFDKAEILQFMTDHQSEIETFWGKYKFSEFMRIIKEHYKVDKL